MGVPREKVRRNAAAAPNNAAHAGEAEGDVVDLRLVARYGADGDGDADDACAAPPPL